MEKTENEEKLSSNDTAIELSTSEPVIFVPNSDAECSADPVAVHSTHVVNNMVSEVLSKQQQQLQELGTSILDGVNDAESNGSFELIDEGRVGDVDSLLRQQQCRGSTCEIGHVRQEAMMEAEEEHANGSECVATARVQDDVRDVQVCACKKITAKFVIRM